MDREKAGLRGMVRSCAEEYEHPGGETHSIKSTYDAAGRLLETRWRHAGQADWVTTRSYNSEGRLIHVHSGKEKPEVRTEDEPAGERPNDEWYTYDQLGRVKEIRSTGREHLVRENVAVAMNEEWPAPPDAIHPPLCGTVNVEYRDDAQLAVVNTYDARGQLVDKTLQRYDENGQIVETTPSMDVTAEVFARTVAEKQPMPGLNAEQLGKLRQAMANVMGGKKGNGMTFRYDDKGRLVEAKQRNFIVEATSRISYNERGERSEARVSFENNQTFPGDHWRVDDEGAVVPLDETGNPNRPPFPTEIFTRQTTYKYEYEGHDEHGNWTVQVKTIEQGKNPYTVRTRRKLTYF